MITKLLPWARSVSLALVLVLSVSAVAEDKNSEPASSSAAKAASNDDVQKLKAQLAAQQAQLEKLSKMLEDQQRVIDKLTPSGTAFRNLGEVVSTTPTIPPAPNPAASLANPTRSATPPSPQGGSGNPYEGAYDVNAPFMRIGNDCLTPVGFMDVTGIWRDKNAQSGVGSNFGSVPFNTITNAQGQNSEFHFNPQNSRIGFRFDGKWKDVRFTGYNEFDFLGTSGSTALSVTNGAYVPRLRLYWVDARKGDWEFLGGQSWSMLTPNRKGISPLPGDLFYSQVIDVNYMAGLTWTRQPGIRVLYHAGDKATFGLSAENPNQYMGGNAGGSAITLPTALGALNTGNQLDASPNISSNNPVNNTPTLFPDIIAKVALDPNSHFHFDVAGIVREFKVYNPNTTGAGALQHFSTNGAGLQFGMNAELFKGFRLITTNFWSDGGGRYLFGQAPDVVVHSDGSLSAVHADGTVDGFEFTHNKWLFYGYYGGIYIGRNALLDANGTSRIGYGQPGAFTQNRAIQEISFGLNQTIWKDAKYGAINLMWQYEYLLRSPWSTGGVALGNPKSAHDNTIYMNVRYTLPGSAPAIK